MTLIELLSKIVNKQGGFLTAEDIAQLALLDRLRNVLVRCGSCRFTCPAQCARHLTAIIARDGADYVRDVSLLASDEAYGLVQPSAPAPRSVDPVQTDADLMDLILGGQESSWREGDCDGVYDGFSVSSDADSGL
jgi:hypothetical protein